eukprot:7443882-Alexandrium_andersonii.AAC.1
MVPVLLVCLDYLVAAFRFAGRASGSTPTSPSPRPLPPRRTGRRATAAAARWQAPWATSSAWATPSCCSS